MLLYILFAVVIVNTAYFILFSKFSFLKPKPKESEHSFPISIIVCAKNEAENLRKNIPLWLDQDYPDFELILIDDASSDDTREVIESFAKDNDKVHTVLIENNETFWSNKKYSMTLGIKRAYNKRMLFTDADCTPASNKWIRLMTAALDKETQLVLGYGAYYQRKGLLNAIIRYETFITGVQYFSYALAGIPYMGVGRNLAYTSELFYDNRGFMSHMNVPSGDDDLFVNESATAQNTTICVAPEAFTYSTPKTSFKEWFLQKRRHITTSKFYKSKHRMLLGVYYISNLLFWLVTAVCLIFIDWKIPVAILIFRFILQYIFIGSATKLLKEKKLLPWLPVLDLFLVFLQLTIFISNKLAKPKRWK
jgi:glycosyltransferase involved in cell wall biosynthesis